MKKISVSAEDALKKLLTGTGINFMDEVAQVSVTFPNPKVFELMAERLTYSEQVSVISAIAEHIQVLCLSTLGDTATADVGLPSTFNGVINGWINFGAGLLAGAVHSGMGADDARGVVRELPVLVGVPFEAMLLRPVAAPETAH